MSNVDIEVKIPPVGESISEVTLGQWMKSDGEYVEAEEIICELESDKTNFEIRAEGAGILHIQVEAGEDIPIGTQIAKITPSEAPPQSQEIKSGLQKEKKPDLNPSESKVEAETISKATGHPSPAAAKILKEKGIPPEQVEGTGPGDRITKADALSAQEISSQSQHQNKEQSGLSKSREERREKISRLRKTISERLVNVKNQTAMLSTFNEVDMQAIIDIRKAYKESFKEKYETSLGFMSFFTKAICWALEEWPSVQARIEENEIVYPKYSDISIAVSTPKGLVVPVIRDAQNLSFHQIEKEIVRLATRAREGKLAIEEMTGGTFTITNGGIFGSLLSTPIINPPQSAILGMHNIVPRPVARKGDIVIRPMMYIALSYDHRVIDGRESVSFLVRVKEYLEDPTRLLLGI
ncbi:MAG: 2-oxoglutarate dehydrogenase complex dihydrolipoyllysine-residue succinyltransferase [Cytophagales bacterium]|nr:2-oxoglutarate dehydrogenase complex dihydrolipoyllysine-residue succinyltransferase [Cytophagales bacterium]